MKPAPPSRIRKKRPGNGSLSSLEFAFLRAWETVHGLDDRPVMQLKFCPGRLWRFDFAWPAETDRVAVEIDGGIFVQGAHNRGPQFAKDAEKHNAAVTRGWALLRYTTLDLRQRPVQIVEEIAALLKLRRDGKIKRTSLFGGGAPTRAPDS